MSPKEQQFNAVFSDHWHELYAYAINILRDQNKAEDIVQEVYMDLWSRGMDPVDNYRAYLYQAVKFQCAKSLKKRKFEPVHLGKLSEVLIAHETDDSSEMTKQLFSEINKTVTTGLPERCQEIFKLRFYENMSYREISAHLNIAVSTVDNQINKALKILKSNTTYPFELLFFISFLLK